MSDQGTPSVISTLASIEPSAQHFNAKTLVYISKVVGEKLLACDIQSAVAGTREAKYMIDIGLTINALLNANANAVTAATSAARLITATTALGSNLVAACTTGASSASASAAPTATATTIAAPHDENAASLSQKKIAQQHTQRSRPTPSALPFSSTAQAWHSP